MTGVLSSLRHKPAWHGFQAAIKNANAYGIPYQDLINDYERGNSNNVYNFWYKLRLGEMGE